jgi:hypothetical protein
MRRKSAVLVAFLLLGSLFIHGSTVLATSVNQMSLANLVGYPGKTVKTEISLEGTDLEERTGFWYAYYKKVEGDSEKMDITSWITIEPKDFSIKQKVIKTFTVEVKVPRNAELGLWGATSQESGKAGHAVERRTYIVFKDAPAGGNVYSGLLIPISVEVISSPNPLTPVINFIVQNIIVIVLSIVILVLIGRPFLKKKRWIGKR